MPSDDKLVKVGKLNPRIDKLVQKNISEKDIFKSKGLLAHILKRKHYLAAKYLDNISDILQSPDYVGYVDGVVELVKIFDDNIFISVKLNPSNNIYYVATMFDVKNSKIEKNLESGRWKKLDEI